MEEKRLVAEWLLEYACCHHMTSVLHVCSKHYMKHDSQDASKNLSADILASKSGVIPARYMLVTLKAIVIRDRAADYEMALQLLEKLFASTTTHIPFKLFSKCEAALKILTLFHHLRVKSKHVIPLLNRYFPKHGLLHPETPNHSRAKMVESQKGFRSFFLPLATNTENRQKYINESLEKDFGSDFVKVLKKHIGDFVCLIEKLLPRPVLLKFIGEPEVLKKLKGLNSPPLTTLVDGLEGKAGLTEPDVRTLLTSVLHEPVEYSGQSRTSPSPDIMLIESPAPGMISVQDKVQKPASPCEATLPHEEHDLPLGKAPITLTIIPLQTSTKRTGSSASPSKSPNKTLCLSTNTKTKLSTRNLDMADSPSHQSAGKTSENSSITSDEDILSPSPQHLHTGNRLLSLSRHSIPSQRENLSPEKRQFDPWKTLQSPTKRHSISTTEESTTTKEKLNPCEETGLAKSSTELATPSKRFKIDSRKLESPIKALTSSETSPRKEPNKQAVPFAEHLSAFNIKMTCSVELHDIAGNKSGSPRKMPPSPKRTIVSRPNNVERPVMAGKVRQSPNQQLSIQGSPAASPGKGSITSDNRRASPRKACPSPRKVLSSPSKKSDEELFVTPLSPSKQLSHGTTVDTSPQKQPQKGHEGPRKRVSWSDEVIEKSISQPASPSKDLTCPPNPRTSPRKVSEISILEPVSPGKTRSRPGNSITKQGNMDSIPVPSTHQGSPRKVHATPSKQLESPSKGLASSSKRLESPNKVQGSPKKGLSLTNKTIDPANQLPTHGTHSQSPVRSSGEMFVTSDESDRSAGMSTPDQYRTSPRKRNRQDDKGLASPDKSISSPIDETESPRKRQKRQDTQSPSANTTFVSPDTSISSECFSSPAQALGSSACSAKSAGQESDEEWHSCVDEVDAQTNNDDNNTCPNDEFTQWCEEALCKIESSIDVPTLIEFLQDVESPDDVRDYICSCLGGGKEAKEFATQFLERRSMFKNNPKQDTAELRTMCSAKEEPMKLVVPDIYPSSNPDVSKKCSVKLYATEYEGLKEQIYK